MTKIVWILNLNNDSFFDWWKYCSVEKAFRRVEEMVAQWADVIELWGFSTKPGSKVPSIDEELNRIIPPLKQISQLNVALSIETCRADIVKEVIKYKNVKYINDTSGLSDPWIIDIINPLGIKYILLHMPTTYEKSNNINPKYTQWIMDELFSFFEDKISYLNEKKFGNIIIDPWFFYHKWTPQNLEIIKKLEELKSLWLPLFIWLSRKSLILPPSASKTNSSLIESYILTFECLKAGVEYVRVHDIKEMKHILKVFELYKDF